MEEFIGKIWHNWVTKAAGGHKLTLKLEKFIL